MIKFPIPASYESKAGLHLKFLSIFFLIPCRLMCLLNLSKQYQFLLQNLQMRVSKEGFTLLILITKSVEDREAVEMLVVAVEGTTVVALSVHD